MIQLNLKNKTSLDEVRKILLPLKDENEYDFSWLEPITTYSLDENVVIYLNNNEPDPNRLISLDLQEHINEVTNLINNNIAKRNEIFEIETQALTKAIEYVQLINTIDKEKTLNDLTLKASFKQSGEPAIDPYENALTSKFNTIANILVLKFSLHNQKGNSLNYGERVRYLRNYLL